MSDWARWMRHSLGAGCTLFGLMLFVFVWWDELGLDGTRDLAGPPHPSNWYIGWILLGLAFVSGAVVGLAFFDEDFWGGYSAFRRRTARLAHVSLATMGLVNILYGISPWPAPPGAASSLAGLCFIVGGFLLPTAFLLAGWNPSLRFSLLLPALLLSSGVFFTVRGEVPGSKSSASDLSSSYLKADASTQFRSMFFNPDLFKVLPHPKNARRPRVEEPK
jgi:hypothetical protein